MRGFIMWLVFLFLCGVGAYLTQYLIANFFHLIVKLTFYGWEENYKHFTLTDCKESEECDFPIWRRIIWTIQTFFFSLACIAAYMDDRQWERWERQREKQCDEINF